MHSQNPWFCRNTQGWHLFLRGDKNIDISGLGGAQSQFVAFRYSITFCWNFNALSFPNKSICGTICKLYHICQLHTGDESRGSLLQSWNVRNLCQFHTISLPFLQKFQLMHALFTFISILFHLEKVIVQDSFEHSKWVTSL